MKFVSPDKTFDINNKWIIAPALNYVQLQSKAIEYNTRDYKTGFKMKNVMREETSFKKIIQYALSYIGKNKNVKME